MLSNKVQIICSKLIILINETINYYEYEKHKLHNNVLNYLN